MVINTDEITTLTNRLEHLRNNETIQVMIEQLRQLNIIANQVNQIAQLGVNAEYLPTYCRMGVVFANRIRELQTGLINQIGQAVLNSLSNHLFVESAIILSLRE